jgi:hypothetical protein
VQTSAGATAAIIIPAASNPIPILIFFPALIFLRCLNEAFSTQRSL